MSQPQQCQIWATPVTCTTAHGNAKSLTHWARPGIKHSISLFLVGFVSASPRQELWKWIFDMLCFCNWRVTEPFKYRCPNFIQGSFYYISLGINLNEMVLFNTYLSLKKQLCITFFSYIQNSISEFKWKFYIYILRRLPLLFLLVNKPRKFE